ncbi:SusC/RagA family TonB-linked outer membrane protein [Hymenobacter sp.]|jgi:TonB-linked SusC/RagA family outer membrane protein|uniref:SusC/RagA family TonB-linked outer membrane protein n=1 Tax=Hymenobacter sp. TaxID=1898978 RepID=UPI002EDB428B
MSNFYRQLNVVLLVLLLGLLPRLLLAQGTVGGVVNDETKQAMPGVSILIKGTTRGTTTDTDGRFSIAASPADVLVFQFVGSLPKEVTVGDQTTLSVVLVTNTQALNEVVVTALGVKKEARTLGYATQEVQGQDLVKAREPNPINGLTGKVAGLTVAPSAEILRRPQVLLRGNSDILYVVDGVPINSDTWNLSPDDIETYTVLKGPTASALYGFRGRNGAILITTKRGTKDARGFSLEVNSSTMLDQSFLAIPKVQDQYGPGDHGVYSFVDGRGAGQNDGDYDVWGPALDGRLLPQYDSPIDPATGKRIPTPWTARGKDNLTRFLQTGVLTTNNIAIGVGNEKYDLRVSGSHSFQRGIVPNTKLNIVNFNVTTGVNFTPKLRWESNINYNRQFTPNFPDVNYGPNSLIYNTVIWGGADWSMDDMRNYWQPGKEGTQQIYAEYQRYNNPYFVAYEWLRGHYKTDVYGYSSLRYKFNDHLSITGRTQITTWDLLRTEKLPYSATTYGREEARGDYREDKRTLFENNTDVLATYNQDISSAFSLQALVGANLRTYRYNSSYVSTDYLNVPGLYNFNNSRNPLRAASFQSEMGVRSAYYSADLTFRKAVTLSTTGRVDQLSTLPSKNDTYFYPSVALSTVLSDYLPTMGPVSFLKARASYANVKSGLTSNTIGATPAGSYPLGYGDQYQSSYDGPSYANSSFYSTPLVYNNQPAAYYTNTLNNPNIKPEESSAIEAGLDVRFLQNRLGLSGTYFVTDNGPRIYNLPTSETAGYTSQLVNAITTRKKGWEVSLTGSVLSNPNGLNWDVLVNWSTYRERLQEIYPGVTELPSSVFVLGSSGARTIKVGERVDQYFSSAFVRTPDGQLINDAGGRPLNTPVAQRLGFVDPDWVWGINNRFRYKALTFSFQFDGRVGGVIEDYVQRQTFRGGRHIETTEGAMGVARAQDVLGVRSYVGPGVVVANGAAINYDVNGNVTNYGELQFAPNTTATFLQDYISRYYSTLEANVISRSFAKLREVTIGYQVPHQWLEGRFIRQASVSVVGRNLLYFAEKKDIDIDQFAGRQGSSDLQTPTLRRYGINLNLTF